LGARLVVSRLVTGRQLGQECPERNSCSPGGTHRGHRLRTVSGRRRRAGGATHNRAL